MQGYKLVVIAIVVNSNNNWCTGYYIAFNRKTAVQFQVLGKGTLVQKPSINEDLQAEYHPICLKFNVILMIQVDLKYNF